MQYKELMICLKALKQFHTLDTKKELALGKHLIEFTQFDPTLNPKGFKDFIESHPKLHKLFLNEIDIKAIDDLIAKIEVIRLIEG